MSKVNPDVYERLDAITERLNRLEKRIDALTQPTAKDNVRSSLAQTLRDIADDIEDDFDEPTPAKKTDPNEDEE